MNTDNFNLCLSVSSVANLFSIIATGWTDLNLVCEGLRGFWNEVI